MILIIEKTRQAIEEFYNISQSYNLKHNRILWWTHLFGGLQTFALYIYNVILFQRGRITVGTFTMNVSALFNLVYL